MRLDCRIINRLDLTAQCVRPLLYFIQIVAGSKTSCFCSVRFLLWVIHTLLKETDMICVYRRFYLYFVILVTLNILNQGLMLYVLNFFCVFHKRFCLVYYDISTIKVYNILLFKSIGIFINLEPLWYAFWFQDYKFRLFFASWSLCSVEEFSLLIRPPWFLALGLIVYSLGSLTGLGLRLIAIQFLGENLVFK